MKRFETICSNWENLFEVNKNVAENKILMRQYFDSLDKPTITSPEAIKGKSKEEYKKIAIASTDLITEEEVKILLVLMEHKACALLINDNAPESFQKIGKKICNQVDSLCITDKDTTSEIKKKYNKPMLHSISKDRIAIQQKILKRWMPHCYRNYEYLSIVSN